MSGATNAPAPANGLQVVASTAEVPQGAPPPPAIPIPLSYLGTINPAASRRFFIHSRKWSSVDTGSQLSTFNLKRNSKFKAQTAGWPVVRVTQLKLHIKPTIGALKRYIQILHTWIPEGEDVPNNAADFQTLQMTDQTNLYPPITGGMPPAMSVECVFGTAELSPCVKPKPVAGGFPIFCMMGTVYDQDGKRVACEPLEVWWEFRLQLGA